MDNPQCEHGRFEQILAQFLAKSLHIILDSRVPSIRPYGGSGEVKESDKWFNLVLGDHPAFVDNLNLLHRNSMEPMIIDIILVQNNPSASSEHDSGTAFAGSYTETTIERWVVQCESRKSMVPHMGDSSFKRTYKKSIILLRSLYSLMRLLPAFRAFRKLSLSSQSCYFDIIYKVSSFSEPFSRAEEKMMKQYTFIPVDAQQGRLSLSVTYRENLADFNLETSASFPPEIITDYVGSPLTDPMGFFPGISKGVHPTLRRTQSSSSAPIQRPQSWTSGLFRAPSLPRPYVRSPPLYRSPYELSSSPSNVYGQRVPPNYKSTHQKGTSVDDDQLSPPFSPSPSPPTHLSGANPVQTRLRSETGPVSIPHPLTGRSTRHDSSNLSLLPMSPRSTKHGSSSHESPSGIRSSRKVDLPRVLESDTGNINPGQKVTTDARDDSGRFSGLLSSSDSPRVGSSRLSFQDDLDGCDFSCPFIVDDVDNSDSRARDNLDTKKGAEASSQASATTRKSHGAAVGALIHMLRNAPPLRQDSSCYTSHSAKTEPGGETGTASGFCVPRKASDALEELKGYKQLKDLLLSKSTTRLGSEGGT